MFTVAALIHKLLFTVLALLCIRHEITSMVVVVVVVVVF